MKNLCVVFILLLGFMLVADVHSWWRRRRGSSRRSYNPEQRKRYQGNTETYCGIQLDVLVVETCHNKWYDIDGCGECRKKRDLGLMSEAEAKSFLKERSIRRKRSIYPSIYEECCNEACSVEEVREHC